MAKSKNKNIIEPESETAALSEHKKKDNKTNVFSASDQNVKEAKDWVDNNQK